MPLPPSPNKYLTNDDTRPSRRLSDDTQPTASNRQPSDTQPIKRRKRWDMVQWLLVGVIVLTSVSLIGTLQLALAPHDNPAFPTSTPFTVAIIANGNQTDISTTAQTVGQLLDEQNISVGPDDAISDAPNTPLQPNMTIHINRARDVRLIVDGETRTLRTPFTNPYDILNRLGVVPRPIDRIWIDGTETNINDLLMWPVPATEIEIERAVAITVQDGDISTQHTTTADTVGDALFELGITLYLTDNVEPAMSTPLTGTTTITIDRAAPVFIEADETTIETRVQGVTVANALTEAGIALNGLDFAIPDEATAVEPGMTITVVRVTEEVISEDDPIAYQTVYQADPDTELDQTRLLQAGQAGISRRFERVRYGNGEEIGREPAGSEIVRQPTNEIIGYGTQIVLRTIDTPEGPRQYWRHIRAYATSYKPESVGGSTTTSIGMTLRKGIIAADPGIIPYRTNLYVPGYGTGLMADTGGPRSSRYWVDLGYSDEDWVSWSRYVDVYLLTPVPNDFPYRLPAFTRIQGR